MKTTVSPVAGTWAKFIENKKDIPWFGFGLGQILCWS